MIKLKEVTKKYLKHPDTKTVIPKRATKGSAGYDFFLKEDIKLISGAHIISFTDIRAQMSKSIALKLYIRSSLSLKGIILANSVGLIDSDYYSNKDNGGNIGLIIHNLSGDTITLKKGEKIAQGVFTEYYTVDDETIIDSKRDSGFGSTGK